MVRKVIVCLSTYNGEKYIKEQIDSILNQTYSNIKIIVRDDGSKDSTVSILKKYQMENKIKLIIGKNVGTTQSFFKCLEASYESEAYFAFSDQDDYWYKDKIEIAVKKLEKENQDIPLLYYSEVDYCNEKLEFLYKSDYGTYNYKFYKNILENFSSGNTQVFNSIMARNIIDLGTKDVYQHDWWLSMIALGVGKIIYDNKATLMYRRTCNSVSFCGKRCFELQKLRFKKFIINKEIRDIKKQINKFYHVFYDKLDFEDRNILELYVKKDSLKKVIKRLFLFRRLRKKLFDEFLCRIAFAVL